MPEVAEGIVSELAGGGVLRVSVNLGNPVLAQGTPEAPRGVTVDISHEVASRLGVTPEFHCFQAARKSFEAAANGQTDICFLAIEPVRAADIDFTAPYVLIEGVYAVPKDSPLRTVEAVDRPGVRIGVRLGSAYELFLTRTLQHATLVRAGDGTDRSDVFQGGEVDAAAGVREPLTEYVAANPAYRLIDGRFMEIRQALGTARGKSPATLEFLRGLIEELKASGFVADALRRSGQTAPVAPPA
jgi:polar amino acid transport system substrate-binding protein